MSGRQLVAQGLRRKDIRKFVRTGWLHDLGGDVFAVGHQALTDRGWRFAALLSGGRGAALSYWTAAVLWGLLEESPFPNRIDVSTRRSDRRGCRGARMHCPTRLDDRDCASRAGLTVTTLFRTLLDLARVADASMLTRLVEAAFARHEIDLLALAAYARAHRRWPGAGRLREACHAVIGPVRLRSTLEAMFRQLAQEANLPDFETNVPFDGQELDVLFRERNAAIELNWFTYHAARSAYRRDQRKSRRVGRSGIALMQIAGEDLEEDLHGVMADVLAFLDHHPPVDNPILGPRPAAPSPKRP